MPQRTGHRQALGYAVGAGAGFGVAYTLLALAAGTDLYGTLLLQRTGGILVLGPRRAARWHPAPTWDNSDTWGATLRHTAKEGRVYVVGVAPLLHGGTCQRSCAATCTARLATG
jgi:hypothetical protein